MQYIQFQELDTPTVTIGNLAGEKGMSNSMEDSAETVWTGSERVKAGIGCSEAEDSTSRKKRSSKLRIEDDQNLSDSVESASSDSHFPHLLPASVKKRQISGRESIELRRKRERSVELSLFVCSKKPKGSRMKKKKLSVAGRNFLLLLLLCCSYFDSDLLLRGYLLPS